MLNAFWISGAQNESLFSVANPLMKAWHLIDPPLSFFLPRQACILCWVLLTKQQHSRAQTPTAYQPWAAPALRLDSQGNKNNLGKKSECCHNLILDMFSRAWVVQVREKRESTLGFAWEQSVGRSSVVYFSIKKDNTCHRVFHTERWCGVSNVPMNQETVHSNWELCLELLGGSKWSSEECGKACQAPLKKKKKKFFISLFLREKLREVLPHVLDLLKC